MIASSSKFKDQRQPIDELRYSYQEISESLEFEREHSALSREHLQRLEIDKIFKHSRKKKRRKSKKSTFVDTLKVNAPQLPRENLELIKQIDAEGTLESLESAIDNGLINKADACRLWADYIGVAYVDASQSIVTKAAVDVIPKEIAEKAQIIGLYVIGDVLTLAMANPRDHEIVRKIGNITNLEISPVFSLPKEIKDALNVHYATENNIEKTIAQFECLHGKIEKSLTDVEYTALAESKPLALILDSILYFAIKERASDVHLEPQDSYVRIRFRIDGRLREITTIPKKINQAVASRLKVLCKINSTEFRFPQDGAFSMAFGGSKAEFRVSFRPISHGLNTVIRILGSVGQSKIMALNEMLISQDLLKPFQRVLKNPNGLVFVTGPTGSGKTTTLYAALNELDSKTLNIATIEDPIEIDMPGIGQSQVNTHIDLNFSVLLRSLLRQDPDVVLVGEIRDFETAKIATEAALTGHLVLSTLHTNNAIQAIVRLLEIGIEPYMVAPSLNCVMGQRLAARLNDKAKEPYTAASDVVEKYFYDVKEQQVVLYRPKVTRDSSEAGYFGRVGLHELLLVSDEIRSLIAAKAGTRELTDAASSMGYRPLRYDGLKKALLGLTTIEEVERVTPVEWSS